MYDVGLGCLRMKGGVYRALAQVVPDAELRIDTQLKVALYIRWKNNHPFVSLISFHYALAINLAIWSRGHARGLASTPNRAAGGTRMHASQLRLDERMTASLDAEQPNVLLGFLQPHRGLSSCLGFMILDTDSHTWSSTNQPIIITWLPACMP